MYTHARIVGDHDAYAYAPCFLRPKGRQIDKHPPHSSDPFGRTTRRRFSSSARVTKRPKHDHPGKPCESHGGRDTGCSAGGRTLSRTRPTRHGFPSSCDANVRIRFVIRDARIRDEVGREETVRDRRVPADDRVVLRGR